MKKEGLGIETKIVHGSRGENQVTGAISFPIYQSATFRHPGVDQSTGFDYSRENNPTRQEVEKAIATLENGTAGFAFSSGMAAISTTLELFYPGDHIIVSDDLYGGTYRLFEQVSKKNGIKISYIDTSNIEELQTCINEKTKGIYIETPSNPMMKVTDIKKISALKQQQSILVIVDNTFLSPYYQRPLELGADIVLHSGTKYLGGHNDTLAGFVVVKDEKLIEPIQLLQKTIGAILSPFDSWLILRGMKTLGIRLKKQQENAMEIAKWLTEKEEIEKVNYVGLEDHKGYEISINQASGFGGMLSFAVKNVETVNKLLKNVKIISYAESLGGVESLITYPIKQTHTAIPKEMREKIGVNDKLLRLSVGIEDVDDLINDLEQAMKEE
ncbi:cystathionine gamma-synthase [Natranaerovirga pectinivora]|uniref:Cystathionine gamma-synthase n=1 Tax=Natranaerovirga pectinivora TaxID=682400 RepID=A0A4V2V0A0_9FIRM|nr:PLP-dependent aspartate aminotransferase family protein [Natranaerovirga pectinivora]TCT14911.1 cystathionine gamma-synthase [Natranaerovirga pectinivora]